MSAQPKLKILDDALRALDDASKTVDRLVEKRNQASSQEWGKPVGLPNDSIRKFTSELKQFMARQQCLEDASVNSESVSTAEIVRRFLAHKRAINVTEATIRSYEDTLRPFARAYPAMPNKPEQVEEYITLHRGENSTAKNIYTVVRLLYNFAESRRLLPFPNPMTLVGKPRAKRKAPKPLTATEAMALLDAIEDDRTRALVYCLFCLGLRLKETRYLRVADIGEDTIRAVRGKERDEPMPLIPEIREALLKLTDGKRPEDYIFQGRNGKPLSDSMVQLIIKRLFAKAGITGVRPSPHTLRHSRGALTAAAGLDTVSSSRLLRHADIKQTERYSQLNLNQLRAKEEIFNPLRIIAKKRLGKKPDCAQC